MKKLRLFTFSTVGAAAMLSLLPASGAMAQSTLNLDEVVVTASPTARTRMKATDAVTSIGEEAIARGGATNAAEVLRAVPGIRSESSGGEGNANVTVRGLPISAGGSRYIQFQEDGLPVLLFGDIAFGTPDQFLRTDYGTDRLEVVRGGGSSTSASNAPGAIVNFISKTGKDAGNAAGYTVGLGSRLNRVDYNYGTTLGAGTYLNLSGFNRTGEGGAMKTGFNSENGGQFRASLTRELDKGGFVRFTYKHLDDITPSLMPVPTKLSGSTVQAAGNVDPRSAFFVSQGMSRDTTFDKNGNVVSSSAADGLHVKSNAFGMAAKFDLGDGWTVNNNFRRTSNSGRFMALFPADNGNDGKAATFTGTLFNTSIDDLDNTFNDLKVNKTFDMGATKITPTFGLFTGQQNVGLTWFWNQYNVPFAGGQATQAGTGWNTWGGCCVRTFNVRYNQNSPYVAVNVDAGPVSVDASLRFENQKAPGSYASGTKTGTGATAGSGTWATPSIVNYSQSKTNHSLGASYLLSKDMSLYARTSSGVNFAADRLLYGTALDGSVPVSFNKVTQTEGGMRGRTGGFTYAGTLFLAKTDESNYEATTQKFTTNSYDAKGLEGELGYRSGSFRVLANATLTNAKITASQSAAEIGKKPRRLGSVVYAVTPTYTMGDITLGGALVGTNGSYADDANTINMPGYSIVNAFASYGLSKQTTVSISANNLFNKLAFTEVEGDGHAARALPGRTIRATLKYNF